jgi:hypothetical protein
MTAATLTNAAAQTVSIQQARLFNAIEAKKVAAQEAIAEVSVTAKSTAKAQASQAVLSLTGLIPVLVVGGIALACSHAGMMMVAKMLPMVLLAFFSFAVLTVFNPGAKQ